jgi:hypothetical protein
MPCFPKHSRCSFRTLLARQIANDVRPDPSMSDRFWACTVRHGVTFPASRHTSHEACQLAPVRPEGAGYQRRKIPPGQLLTGPVADERLTRVTARTVACPCRLPQSIRGGADRKTCGGGDRQTDASASSCRRKSAEDSTRSLDCLFRKRTICSDLLVRRASAPTSRGSTARVS